MTNHYTACWPRCSRPCAMTLAPTRRNGSRSASSCWRTAVRGWRPLAPPAKPTRLGLDERMEMLDALGRGRRARQPADARRRHLRDHRYGQVSGAGRRLGCGGVLMLPPFYYKGVSDEGVFRSVAEVIERVGDDRLQVYVYHIPPIAVVGFSLKVIERLIKAYPDHCRRHQGQFGRLEQPQGDPRELPRLWRPSPARSASCCRPCAWAASAPSAPWPMSSPGTFATCTTTGWPTMPTQVQDAFNIPREALREYAPIPALKEILAVRTGDACWRNVRPPLVNLYRAAGSRQCSSSTQRVACERRSRGAWILYGANGYTGELTARMAVQAGMRPILAGRNAAAVAALAQELGLDYRLAALDDAQAVDQLLGAPEPPAGRRSCCTVRGRSAARRSRWPTAVCGNRVHYLDITGEIAVFEALAARYDEARRPA